MTSSADSKSSNEAPAVLSESLGAKVASTPVLMVGAGGIGCELLKNLVLSGFKNITVVDLDTIDVTNLNRQFLFHRQHVGKSKAEVARESAISFVPDANIKALHKSITTSEFGVTFYKQFSLVLNALDNRAARSHVNRMCLAANVPLIESGTSGYLGQVTVIRKAITECFDCQVKPHKKSFPGCTIRNTPSEPIHCIVWSKHLFSQLFGEPDADNDVSPDSGDPELDGNKEEHSKEVPEEETKKNVEENKPEEEKKNDGNIARVSTRDWAIENDHNPKTIFQKLFYDDINVLLKMDKLWTKRTKPTPLDWDNVDLTETSGKKEEPESNTTGTTSETAGGIKDQAMWSLKKCRDVFSSSITILKNKVKASDYKEHLVWDKDDEAAMDFVAACANIRSHVFGITQKSRFDIKSMAGNIIPAIATTNAVIAGCIVMEALKILNNEADRCRAVFLRRTPNPRKKILVTEDPVGPNPKCVVCAAKPEVSVRLDLAKVTIRTLEERILKGEMAMIAPDAEIEGKGVVLLNSEEPTDATMQDKTLKEMGLVDGSILTCDDFLQDYNVKMVIYQYEELPQGVDFQVIGDIQAQLEAEKENKSKIEENKEDDDIEMIEEQGTKDKEPAAKNDAEDTKSIENEVQEKEEKDEDKKNDVNVSVEVRINEVNKDDDNSKKRPLDENENSEANAMEAKKPRNEDDKVASPDVIVS